MRTVYINLDSRGDRRERMQHRLNTLGLRYERMAAVTPEFVFYELDKLGMTNNSNLSPAALACYVSHYKVLSQSIGKTTLILEDDALFVPNFNEALQDCLNRVPVEELDILHLGLYQSYEIQSTHAICKPQSEWLAHAYIVNKKAIPVLLDELKVIDRAIDHALFLLQDKLRIFDIRPSLVTQDHSHSSIK